MSKFSKRVVIALAIFAVGVSAVVGYYLRGSQHVRLELPNHRWEPLFFKLIDRTTELAGLEQLRKLSPANDDIEVRVWRGFGLGNLEGVILRRTKNQWDAFHIETDDHFEPKAVLDKLNPPRSGWDPFWKNVTDLGLLTLRDPSEKKCEDGGLDGTKYVVEINSKGIYRTFQMRDGGECEGVRQIEDISDTIGEEFDPGREECVKADWFSCAKLVRSHRERQREKQDHVNELQMGAPTEH